MTKSSTSVACLGLVCLCVASGALADPIKVTSGSLVFRSGSLAQSGPFTLIGTRGFSLDGLVDAGASRVDPLSHCLPCVSSSTMSVGLLTGGDALVGTDMTLDGHTYSNIGSASQQAGATLEFIGTVAIPELGESPIVLTAPFTLRGRIFQPFPIPTAPILGGGIAELRMTPGPFWQLQSVRYDFVATPTPEPATLFLFGAGLAAIALGARRRTGTASL